MALVKGLDEARNKPQASKGQSRLIQKYGSDLPLSCCTNKLDYLAVESVNERITKAANRMTAIKSLQNEGIFKAEHLDREWLNSIDEVAKQPESILEKPLPHYLLSDNPTYFGVPQRKSKFAEWGQRQNPGSGSKLTEQNDLPSDTDNLLTSHSSIPRDLKVPPDLADILTSHDDEPTSPTNGRPEAGRQKEEEHGQLLPGPLRCLVEPRSNPLFDWSDAPSLSPSPSPSPSPTPPPTFMSSKTNETGNTTTSMFDDLEEEVVDIEGLMEERLDCGK
ncbi:unnamed protein product [Protopolystoma xenopodis]|uniref:Uncharacterized protein n=1 Tax=Protopolystoma xenopodis TaxID=117903 RepID=A0A448XDS5_9PLAT|nr:unnamed protein product [Protopolystoma xenopodis]